MNMHMSFQATLLFYFLFSLSIGAKATITSDSLIVEIDSITQPLCFGDENGAAHLAVLLGEGPFTYQWSNGDSTEWATNLGEGFYSVLVTTPSDSTIVFFGISQPNPVIANIATSSPTIPCGGQVLLTTVATGGTEEYTYSWLNTNNNSDTLVVDTAGYFCVQVEDTNGCGTTTCIGVNFDESNIFCNGITGGDSLTCHYPTRTLFPAVSASDTIYYSWSGPEGFSSNDTFPKVSIPGTYTLTASTPGGCTCSSSIDIISRQEFEIDLDITPALCAYTNDGQALMNVQIGDYPPFSLAPDVNFDSLSSQHYNIYVYNGVGCYTVLDFDVTSPDAIQLQADTILPSDNLTSLGTIISNTAGGTMPYSWHWSYESDSTFESFEDNIMGLYSGQYFVDVDDANGCHYEFGPIEVPFGVGVDDLSFEQSLSVFPNPASDYLLLTQNTDQLSRLHVQLFDLNRRILGDYHFSERTNTINILHLATGIYELVIWDKHHRTSRRFIIDR